MPVSIETAELYNPTSNTFLTTGGLAGSVGFDGSLFGHTASLLTDGTVLVIGGVQQAVEGGQLSSTVLSTVELYQ